MRALAIAAVVLFSSVSTAGADDTLCKPTLAPRATGAQVADDSFNPPIKAPAYAEGRGPKVLLDEAHNNFPGPAASSVSRESQYLPLSSYGFLPTSAVGNAGNSSKVNPRFAGAVVVAPESRVLFGKFVARSLTAGDMDDAAPGVPNRTLDCLRPDGKLQAFAVDRITNDTRAVRRWRLSLGGETPLHGGDEFLRLDRLSEHAREIRFVKVRCLPRDDDDRNIARVLMCGQLSLDVPAVQSR